MTARLVARATPARGRRQTTRSSPGRRACGLLLAPLLALASCDATGETPPPADGDAGQTDAPAREAGATDGDDAGDGAGGGSTTCPASIPTRCPPAAPSFAQDVRTILQQRCTPCHAPGGVEAKRSLDTYAHVAQNRGEILFQLGGCRMPPAGSTALLESERQVVLSWLVCGAPDN